MCGNDMARMARVVVPNIPHHITQRGNRRQETFFCDEDYHEYLALMAASCERYGVDIWAYCLMPNHTHVIAVPRTENGLQRAIGEAHRRYTRRINFRENWRGHLWQERFASYPMGERYLLAAARYIELNPVRARMVKDPGKYRWSSAPAHINGHDDILVRVGPLLDLIEDWGNFLSGSIVKEDMEKLRLHERTGRPLGDEIFMERLEEMVGRNLRRQKPGRKKKRDDK